MNCRPGDLAIIVRGINAGVLVSVIRPTPPWCRTVAEPTEPTWEVELLSSAIDLNSGRCECPGQIGDVCDSILRPIRDPGDDARDESFSWCPAPEKVIA